MSRQKPYVAEGAGRLGWDLGGVLANPVVWAAAAGWLALSAGMVGLGQGEKAVLDQVGLQWPQLAFQLAEIALIVFLTRNRRVPSLAERAPARRRAAVEIGAVLAYVAAAQVGGVVIGHLIGGHALSLHLAGSVYGGGGAVAPREIVAWCAYNLVAYAVIPYVAFRGLLGYDHTRLGLRSLDRRRDAALIVAVLAVESTAQLLLSPAILHLTASQLLLGAPAAFVINFTGTVLPVMILIYGILLPRWTAVTGSTPAAVVLGGLTYAAVHVFEPSGVFTSPAAIAMSLGFVLLHYFGPGMVKSVLTLRTGNAWVHVWAYHAIAPHVLLDTPVIVRLLHLG